MRFLLNGRQVDAGEYPPQTTLLDFIRTRGLIGAKEGCAEGECGACAVVMVKDRPGGSEYRPVNSCLLFLPMAAGQEIYTVESLAQNGRLSEVQSAIAECGGSQCGYCTPGFVMSLFAEYYRPGREGKCNPEAMAGNLCRCTGYRPLQQAALSLGPAPADDFRARLSEPAPALEHFEYHGKDAGFVRPRSLDECLRLLEAHPEARVVAGATDLAVDSNLRDRRWRLLIGLDAVEDLRCFRDTAAGVEIGAGLALSEVEARWTNQPAAAREWFALFASPLIRNRATLGGNLATASPIGDAAPLLLALGARLKIAGVRGERVAPLDRFFCGYRETALERAELIVSIVVPKPYPRLARFFKIAKRRLDDISTVAAAFAIDLDASEKITLARVAYGGVAATPVRARGAEDALLGRFWSQAAADAAQSAIVRELRPIGDHRGSAAYRTALARNLFAKFFIESGEAMAV